MRILVLGSGAREHAIITSLLSEGAGHEITAAPGNAGISAQVETVGLDPSNGKVVTQYAVDNGIELVIVGPEAPLVAGVSDHLQRANVPVFGPTKKAAQLEGSKAFAKRIMDAANVPTGRATRAETVRDAEQYWLQYGAVLVEEFLEGQEVSLFFLSDGENVLPLEPAQDYKRAHDGDEGPNTGGMGAYSPLPWLPSDFVDEVEATVALPTVRQLAVEGTPFVGLLYCGLIVTSSGVRVIEFNARFGDPETQVVLPRLQTPLSELLLAAATGGLGRLTKPKFSDDVAVTVVLASEGYPENPITGRPITGLERALEVDGVTIAHAATALAAGQFVATGGRVLSVVATGSSFAQARERAYEALSHIELQGSHYRTDIALRVAE